MQNLSPLFGSLQTAVIFIGIILLTILVATIISKLFRSYIKYATEVLQNNPTNYQFLRHSITALIYLLGIGWALFTIPVFQTVASSILAGAGILAIATGIASQHALSNIMSGIFIIVFKPFRVNDRLTIKKNLTGIVEDITLRHTIIRDFENKRIIIPNTVISNEILINANLYNDKICKWIDLKISFESDLKKAKSIIQKEIENHPLHLDVRTDEDIAKGVPKVQVRVLSIGDFAIHLRAWAWTKDAPDGFVLSCDCLESIKYRFDAEGIEIPYPHYTVIQKNTSPSKTQNI